MQVHDPRSPERDPDSLIGIFALFAGLIGLAYFIWFKAPEIMAALF